MGWGVSELHWWLFAVPPSERLSALTSLEPLRAVAVPLVGGLIFGLALMALARLRPTREVDPIEANALHGGRSELLGRMSVAAPGSGCAGRVRRGGRDRGRVRSAARRSVLCVRNRHRELFGRKPGSGGIGCAGRLYRRQSVRPDSIGDRNTLCLARHC